MEDTVTNTAAETQVAPQNTTTEQAAPQATTTTTETAAGTVDTETTATPESTSAAPTETSTEEQGSETATPQAVAPAPKKSIEDILKENGYEEELQVLQNAKQQKQMRTSSLVQYRRSLGSSLQIQTLQTPCLLVLRDVSL